MRRVMQRPNKKIKELGFNKEKILATIQIEKQ